MDIPDIIDPIPRSMWDYRPGTQYVSRRIVKTLAGHVGVNIYFHPYGQVGSAVIMRLQFSCQGSDNSIVDGIKNNIPRVLEVVQGVIGQTMITLISQLGRLPDTLSDTMAIFNFPITELEYRLNAVE